MKKRLLACLLTAAMLVSLFPLPALAAEAERPEWMVTAFDPLDGDTAAQTVPQGGEPVLPDSLTAWAYVIEDDTAVIPPPEGLEQEPDIQSVTIPGVTWEAQPEFDPDAPGEYVYTPVLPAAYEVAGEVELPVISVTVTAAEQTALQRVQALIDALPAPEDITAENRAGVEAQLAAIDTARAELTGEKMEQLNTSRYQAVVSALAALDGQAGADVPMLVNNPAEQFSALIPGNTYWFDLSEEGIPGTVNTGNSYGVVTIPDTTLHWVPFTYAGTVNAYKLTSAQATTEEYANQNKYDHSLFIADYNVTYAVSWKELNGESMIFGKAYTSGGVGYTLRAPSAGSYYTGDGDYERGTPQSNEWDMILDKGAGYIKNWGEIFSWGQDTNPSRASARALRGHSTARSWCNFTATNGSVKVGFRPVLEILNPGALTSGISVVTLNLNGGKAGTTATAQDGLVSIVVKSDESFVAPVSEGLTAPEGGVFGGWKSGNTVYQAGGTVPDAVTSLTAYWLIKPSITARPENKTVAVGETATFTVTVSGDPAPTYQWQVNKDGGTNWEDIDGAAGSRYTTAAATMSMNGWRYRCVATNSQGSTESSAATLTVNKLTPNVNVSAASGLTYNGSAQALISAGSTSGGELQYSLEENDNYSTDIPTGTDAGDYTVYYKVVGNDNYNDVAAQSITVTIAKATPTPDTPTGLTAIYGQTLADVTLPTGWAWDNSSTPVGDIGSHSFPATYTQDSSGNYNTVQTNLSVTVSAAPRTITVTGQADSPTQITLNEAVIDPSGTGGTVSYGKNTANIAPSTWQTGKEFSGLTADTTYYFFAKVEADGNYDAATSEGVAISTPAKAVSSIAIAKQLTTLAYTSGQTLDLSGLSVTVAYNDSTAGTIEWSDNKLTADPAAGTVLTVTGHNGKTVTVSYGGQTATTDALTVTQGTQATASITGAPATIYNGDSFTLTLSGGSGTGAVTWEIVSGPATVDATTGKVTVTGAGEIQIKAVKAADTDYTQAEAAITLNAVARPSQPTGGGGSYTPPSTPTYPPTVEKPGEGGGGTPSVAPSNPKQGDTVTVKPKPDDGYEVDNITITDKNGKPVEVTVKPDGTYTFKQPNGKVTIEVSYKAIEKPWNNPFSDASEGDWYYEAVRFVQERGLMNGYSDGRFGANDTLSRAQLAQILFNKECQRQ